MVDAVLTGRLLVSSPWLQDENFARTVVLVLDHGEGGALGLVLNRPSTTSLGDALPDWVERAADPRYVYVGGPVGSTSAICLARTPADHPAVGWQPLFGGLGTVDLGRDPSDIGVPIERLRVFAGHSGWGAGQLEDEIAADMWYVVDADPSDAMSAHPETLWRQVLRRQGEPLASVANFPLDLSLN